MPKGATLVTLVLALLLAVAHLAAASPRNPPRYVFEKLAPHESTPRRRKGYHRWGSQEPRTVQTIWSDRSYDYLVLSIQRCFDISPWTIHGMWPSDYDLPFTPISSKTGKPRKLFKTLATGERVAVPTRPACNGSAYNETVVADLMADLTTFWTSCAWSLRSQQWLLEHEWDKHGTCYGVRQIVFFRDVLDAFHFGNRGGPEGWHRLCDGKMDKCVFKVILGARLNPANDDEVW